MTQCFIHKLPFQKHQRMCLLPRFTKFKCLWKHFYNIIPGYAYLAKVITNRVCFSLVKYSIVTWRFYIHIRASAERAFHKEVLLNIIRKAFRNHKNLSLFFKMEFHFLYKKWSLQFLRKWWSETITENIFVSHCRNVVGWWDTCLYLLLSMYWSSLKRIFFHASIRVSFIWTYDFIFFKKWRLHFWCTKREPYNERNLSEITMFWELLSAADNPSRC